MYRIVNITSFESKIVVSVENVGEFANYCSGLVTGTFVISQDFSWIGSVVDLDYLGTSLFRTRAAVINLAQEQQPLPPPKGGNTRTVLLSDTKMWVRIEMSPGRSATCMMAANLLDERLSLKITTDVGATTGGHLKSGLSCGRKTGCGFDS